MDRIAFDYPEDSKRILRARADRLDTSVDAMMTALADALVKQELIDEDPILSIFPTVEKIEERAAAKKASRITRA